MYDLVIVGGGIAGLCAALAAPEGLRVVVVDKGEAGAGSSPLAQGGLAAAVGPQDSTELHRADTLAAGAGICDPDVVADICAAGPEAVSWLEAMGCRFDREPSGALDLSREGGQSVARSVHQADATGQEIVRALRVAVRDRKVERVARAADSLVVVDGRCIGVTSGTELFLGGTVLLATGGAGGLWGITTNAPGATGDGIVLALAAGAQVADLEFMQFHPTVLDDGSAGQRVLLTEALRGEGATLVDGSGERFVDELAPRHVVAKAILDRPRAYLDCRTVPGLERRFPTIIAGARARGFDPATEPLPVSPAAHYYVGGVASDAYGRTSVRGLYAAGECAASGMHGANRMAGNSLLETVVIGRRVGASVTGEAVPTPAAPAALRRPLGPPDPAIARILMRGVGPIRDADGLDEALAAIDRLAPSGHAMLAGMIARAAAARVESRGVHIRSDAPAEEPSFAMRSFDRPPGTVPH